MRPEAVIAQSVTVTPPDAGVEAARAALERAFNLPSAGGPPPAPTTLGAKAAGLIGNIAKLGLGFVAGRYLSSEGELNLAKDTGQIGRSVTMGDMRLASAAMERQGWTGEGMGTNWSADQRTRFIEGAADLERLRAGGRIGADTFSRSMNSLFQTIAQQNRAPGPLVGPPAPTQPTAPSPPVTSLPQPTPQASRPPQPAIVPAPRFDGAQLGSRIEEFLPRAGSNPPQVFGTQGGDAARKAAADWNRASDTTVAVPLQARYWDPATKQQADTWVLYTGVDPASARGLAGAVDRTGQFNVLNRGSALRDAGLSEAGLSARADRMRDRAFAEGLPVIGGRRMQPLLSNADYGKARETIRTNNTDDLSRGRIDTIDLVAPLDGGRGAFIQDVTRGQAASALNTLQRTGLLRDGVSVGDVIGANGLGSVLATDRSGRVVPKQPPAPGRSPQTPRAGDERPVVPDPWETPPEPAPAPAPTPPQRPNPPEQPKLPPAPERPALPPGRPQTPVEPSPDPGETPTEPAPEPTAPTPPQEPVSTGTPQRPALPPGRTPDAGGGDGNDGGLSGNGGGNGNNKPPRVDSAEPPREPPEDKGNWLQEWLKKSQANWEAIKGNAVERALQFRNVVGSTIKTVGTGLLVTNAAGAAGGAIFYGGLQEQRTGKPITPQNAVQELGKLQADPLAYLESNYTNAIAGLNVGDRLYNMSGNLLEVTDAKGAKSHFRRVPLDLYEGLKAAQTARGNTSEQVFVEERHTHPDGRVETLEVEIRPPFRAEPLRDAQFTAGVAENSKPWSFGFQGSVRFGPVEGQNLNLQADAFLNYRYQTDTTSTFRVGLPSPTNGAGFGIRQQDTTVWTKLGVAASAIDINPGKVRDLTDPTSPFNDSRLQVANGRVYIDLGNRNRVRLDATLSPKPGGGQDIAGYARARETGFLEIGLGADFLRFTRGDDWVSANGYLELQAYAPDLRAQVDLGGTKPGAKPGIKGGLQPIPPLFEIDPALQLSTNVAPRITPELPVLTDEKPKVQRSVTQPFAPTPTSTSTSTPTPTTAPGAASSAFAASLPVIGGRRFQPIADNATYASERDASKAANSADIRAGKRDEIDLVVPTDGGRGAVLRGLTRGQAATALASFVATGLLRDGVSIGAVIAANGLADVLAVDPAGRVVVAPATVRIPGATPPGTPVRIVPGQVAPTP